MKKIALLTVILSGFLIRSCININWTNGISGNGNVVSEVIEIKGFTGIQASSNIDVNISQGDYKVEMLADDNLHDYITVEKVGDMLKIGSERNIYRADSKVVNVTLPDLKHIKVNSSADIDAKSDFVCKDLDIEISSSGDLELGVDADDIHISISSSGDCKIWGTTNTLNARLSSSGDLRAFDLEADYVSVSVSSSADASLFANKEIDMSASSSGNIYYKGDAIVKHSSTSSSGGIYKR